MEIMIEFASKNESWSGISEGSKDLKTSQRLKKSSHKNVKLCAAAFTFCMGPGHRLENRCVLRHISNMNFLSRPVLGSEKKNRNCHKYATFKASFILCFYQQKEILTVFYKYPSIRTEKLQDLKLK